MNCLTEIKKMGKFCERYTQYTETLRKIFGDRGLNELAEFRGINKETLVEAGIFYIQDMAELLVPDFLGDLEEFGLISKVNNKPIFHDRYVIPIKNTEGKVINLVGYSTNAIERYVYATSKYYRRKDTLYGLENLHLAYELGYAVLTEGITDVLRLRSLGIKNAFGNCGTHSSDVVSMQLNRCHYGVIIIPDRDEAGLRALGQWKFHKYIVLYPAVKYKDIDEMLREHENIEWFNSYFNECVKILKSEERKGVRGRILEVTIL